MKRVLLCYDIANDLIECSDRIADNFDEIIGGLRKWIKTDPAGAEYMVDLGDGEIGCIESTESILKYLNLKCLEAGEPKARLYKANISNEYLETVEIWAWERFDENTL